MSETIGRKSLTAEDFVRLWQRAQTLDEVSERSGLSKGACSCRANNYREHGVPLKRFHAAVVRPDYHALAKLAQELAPKENTDAE